ncbi:MAG: hypothetical protein GXO76_12570 [Calditrichaeota bacterium]|nr:hypothetical protein [Calditrichota bacterium]
MAPEKKPEEIQRFSWNIRIQHFILLTSMIVLCLTGLALMFHDTWFGHLVIKLEGGFEARGIIHRIFAVILVLLGIYHSFYVLFTEEGHQELMKLLPTWKDVQDFFHSWTLSLSGKKESREFGKYSFINKIQYWGVVLGFIVMVISGGILWFRSISMAIFPKWVIDLVVIFHGWQGLIIFIVLFLWHLYNVHLNPDYFPMSKVWLTGKISVDELKRKHYLEYVELFKEDGGKAKDE